MSPGDSLPDMVAEALRELGVTHVVTVPDNTSAPILAALEGAPDGKSGPFAPVVCADRSGKSGPFAPVVCADRSGESEPSAPVVCIDRSGEAGPGVRVVYVTREGEAGPGVRVVYATREGEAVALAAGLWLGGATPVVLIQNTGLLEAGDGLRGTASRMGMPLLMLVTLRGYEDARVMGVDPGGGVRGREDLVHPPLDSVALMTEPTLRAWGIPFVNLGDPRDPSPLRQAWRMAVEEERPVALLLGEGGEAP